MAVNDKIIEGIRESRRRMSNECAHDPARYIEYLRTFDRKYTTQIERYRREHPIPASRAESTR